MSVFGTMMSKILGHSARASEAKVNEARASAPAAAPTPSAAPAATSASAPASTATATPAPAPMSMATIEAALTDMAAGSKQKLDWRNSIVDLMKLVGIDSDITNRRALANELGYTGDLNDSATMNVWLHKEVMQRMAESGGQVPANLKD
jgi:Rieske Fe-S protein